MYYIYKKPKDLQFAILSHLYCHKILNILSQSQLMASKMYKRAKMSAELTSLVQQAGDTGLRPFLPK